MDAIQPVVNNYEAAVLNLKKSVRSFELFDQIFANLEGKDAQTLEQEMNQGLESGNKGAKQVPLAQIVSKLVADEFFSLEPPGELLPADFKHYDLKKNAENEQLCKILIKNSQTILPI